MNALKDPQRHDDFLNYQLKRLLTLGGAPAIRLCEGGFGVARQEWRLTAALVEHGPMSVGELSQRAHVEAARISRTVRPLMRKGLVARVAVPGDRRRVLLQATARGHALYRELFPRLAAINRRLMEVLDPAEAELLAEFLRRLTAHAQAIHDEGGGVAEKTGRYLGTGRRRARLASLVDA